MFKLKILKNDFSLYRNLLMEIINDPTAYCPIFLPDNYCLDLCGELKTDFTQVKHGITTKMDDNCIKAMRYRLDFLINCYKYPAVGNIFIQDKIDDFQIIYNEMTFIFWRLLKYYYGQEALINLLESIYRVYHIDISSCLKNAKNLSPEKLQEFRIKEFTLDLYDKEDENA